MTARTHNHRTRTLILAGVLALGGLSAAVASGGTPARTTPEEPQLQDLTQEFRQVAETMHPSVVRIEIHAKAPQDAHGVIPEGGPWSDDLLRRFFGGDLGALRQQQQDQQDGMQRYDPLPMIGGGSGWVWSSDGLIVTNNHVVKEAEQVIVQLADGRKLPAKVVGTDPATDVALLKIDADGLTPAVVSDQPVSQGDIVFTFGSPFSFTDSMSQGIVAGIGRQTGILGRTGYEEFIQTDAAINPGNSGGPLVDVRGRVVGMNTAILSSTGFFGGIGFAIPATMIRPIVEQLADHGSVQRGWLGVSIQDDPDLVASFGKKGGGVVIGSVLPDGPAANAGLQRGDVILSFDGDDVKDMDTLRLSIAEHRPGTTAHFTVLRNGKQVSVDVKLGEAPSSDQQEAQLSGSNESGPSSADPWLNLRKLGFEELTPSSASDPGGEGVLVQAVRPGSALADKGVVPGDVITEVEGVAVHDTAELSREIQKVDLTKGVRLSVRSRDGIERYVFVHVAV